MNDTIDIAEQKEHPEAYTYYLSGIKKAKNEDYQGAISDYNKAIELSPSYGDYYFSRCIAKDNLKDHLGSLDDAKHAARCNNYESRYYYAVGNALSWFNKKGESMSNIMAFYGVAVRYNTDSANADRYSQASKEAQVSYNQMKEENDKAKDCLELYREDDILMATNNCNKPITAQLLSDYSGNKFYIWVDPNKKVQIGSGESKLLRVWIYGGLVPF